MPCDTRSYSLERRQRAIDGLTKSLKSAQTTVTETSIATGDTTFVTRTDDGFVLTGTMDTNGNVTGLRIEGWDLQQRSGWCDGCALEALKGTDPWQRIIREVQSGAAGVGTYNRDAIKIGR